MASHSSDKANPLDSYGELLPAFTVTLSPDAFGIPSTDTVSTMQADAFKELVNKIAWAVGSAYQVPYAGERTRCRTYVRYLVADIMRDHGYPVKIVDPVKQPT